MKTILAYGDSITWGSNPAAGGQRHAPEDRWPNVLAAGLGPGFEVISEGMRGRTTAFDDNLADGDRNGARLLPSLLYTHAPLDLVILMLGTNDLKPATAGSAAAVMLGMKRCIEIVLKHSPRLPGLAPAKVLLVAPPRIVPTPDAFFSALFEGAAAESEKIAGLFKLLSIEFDTGYCDAGSLATASPIDGVHLDAANTRAIGLGLVPVVRSMVGAGPNAGV
jgi:lysophospholipase L1-like esterase